jgi:hypothetical protein
MANVFNTSGAGLVVDQLDAFGTFYIGWGTGAGTAAVGDTTLFTESAESRVAATKSQPSANILQWVGTMTASAGRTITNAGVLSASSGGTLVVKSDFTGVVLNTSDKIEFTFQLSFS